MERGWPQATAIASMANITAVAIFDLHNLSYGLCTSSLLREGSQAGISKQTVCLTTSVHLRDFLTTV